MDNQNEQISQTSEDVFQDAVEPEQLYTPEVEAEPLAASQTKSCEKLNDDNVQCNNFIHLRRCQKCNERFCHQHASSVSPIYYCSDCLPAKPEIYDEVFERTDKIEDWNEETDEVTVEYITKHCRKITFKNSETGEFFSKYIYERSDKELEHDVIRWKCWIQLAEDEILKRRTELAKQYAAKTGVWPPGHRVPNYPDYALKPVFKRTVNVTTTTSSGTKTTTTTKTKLRGAKTAGQTYNVRQIMDEIKALGQMQDKQQALAELQRLQDLLAKAQSMTVQVKA
jgi:hypothetical protein